MLKETSIQLVRSGQGIIHLYLILFLLLIVGCSSKEMTASVSTAEGEAEKIEQVALEASVDETVVTEEPTVVKPLPYVELGDLDELRKRGVVRLLAPRFDSAQELARSGLPAQEYQELAERFVNSLELGVQWIYVDGFDDLLTSLNDGQGDLVVTNLSMTSEREKDVEFSVDIATVDEILITKKDSKIKSLKELAGTTVTIPGSRAHQETLLRLKKKYPDLNIEVKEDSLSHYQMLQQVASGQVTATVVDSDIAALLMPQFPSLTKGPRLKKNRKIAWALRKNNSQLRSSLNEFLVAEHIQSGRSETALRSWKQIKKEKKLRVLTLNNPASYFMWRGELMGFDYDLMKHFARKHKLLLEVIVKDDIDGLIDALENGEGDVIASSLTVTPERKERGVIFSRRYMKIREQLVGLKKVKKIDSVEQLEGKRVAVNPQTAFFQRLQSIQKQGVNFEIIEKPSVSTETLITGLTSGEYDFTVADSHLAAIENSYRDDLRVQLDLSGDVDIAWGLRSDQPVFLDKLNAFIKKEYRGLYYNITFKKYFVSSKNIKKHQKYRVVADGALSPYDKKIKKHAKPYTVDWRLITSQIYQESKFNPKAKSFAGAQGLMQVMPRTAREFGYDNLYDPDRGIAAGLAYLHWLHDRFPGDMPLDERLYFVLASYNAGAGHVRDARHLAKELGKNPDRWFGNVEEAMLLLSKASYAKKARFGYVRGREPVNYVRNIRDRYLGYLRVADIDGKPTDGEPTVTF